MKFRFLLSLLLLSPTWFIHPKNIAVIGTGYVGLVLGAALAEFGNTVTCLDIIQEKIDMLNNGQIPIFEPGLDEIISRNKEQERIYFSSDVEKGIQEHDIIFIAVGTPTGDDGKADLRAVESVARMIGKNLKNYKLICTKSTVPIGTGKNIVKRIICEYASDQEFDVASNPEFLREGSAIQDFLEPNRVVIGIESERAQKTLEEIYEPLTSRGVPLLVTNIPTAEAIKYASNAFLATKISFINEMAQLCDIMGADIKYVAQGMGTDNRIGQAFLSPGPGYGGSCFPKDTLALLYTAESNGAILEIVSAAVNANRHQKYRIFKKLKALLDNDVQGKTVAILGLAFKANTDDIREAPAISIIQALCDEGASVKAYDPQASENMQKIFSCIEYCTDIESTVTDADLVLVLTEWPEIANMDLEMVKNVVRQPILLDARNLFEPSLLRQLGFKFDNVGRSSV